MAAHFFEIWTVRKRRYMKTAFLSSKTAKYFFFKFCFQDRFSEFFWNDGGDMSSTEGRFWPLYHTAYKDLKPHSFNLLRLTTFEFTKIDFFLKIQKWSIVEVNDSPRGASPIAKKYVIFSRSIKDYSHIHRCSPQVTIWKKFQKKFSIFFW